MTSLKCSVRFEKKTATSNREVAPLQDAAVLLCAADAVAVIEDVVRVPGVLYPK